MALALQVNSVEDLAQEIQLILKAKPPTDLREGWSSPQARPSSAACPSEAFEGRRVPGSGAPLRNRNVQHRDTAELTLSDLPILKCWPKDGGRFITLPNVHTRDPETGARNVGMYRMQVYDERTTAMHWQVHKVGRPPWQALLRTQ